MTPSVSFPLCSERHLCDFVSKLPTNLAAPTMPQLFQLWIMLYIHVYISKTVC